MWAKVLTIKYKMLLTLKLITKLYPKLGETFNRAGRMLRIPQDGLSKWKDCQVFLKMLGCQVTDQLGAIPKVPSIKVKVPLRS